MPLDQLHGLLISSLHLTVFTADIYEGQRMKSILVLGITKSGTSASGLMRLVLKTSGMLGGPLYSFRYSGSAPAVYSTRLSEHVSQSLRCTFSLYHVWKIVLLAMASVSAAGG